LGFAGEKLQPIEALKGTDKFLEVPLRGTSKNLSRFYKSAKRCNNRCYLKLILPFIPQTLLPQEKGRKT
jgi:hypothetical protein